MKNYLGNYVKEIDKKIEEGKISKEDLDNHLIKIKFFQHERLIHLLVTLFYGIFMFLSVMIFQSICLFVIILYLVIIILIFYVKHYFYLENNVQYLYVQYDKMKKLVK